MATTDEELTGFTIPPGQEVLNTAQPSRTCVKIAFNSRKDNQFYMNKEMLLNNLNATVVEVPSNGHCHAFALAEVTIFFFYMLFLL